MPGVNGGIRPGAGRPPGRKNNSTISKELAREVFRALCAQHAEALHEAQFANAKGIKYLVGREKGSGKFTRLTQAQVEAVLAGEDDKFVALEVWEKDPSVQAYTDLMNRFLDKPREQEQVIQITGELVMVSDRLLNARKRLALKSGKG